MVLRLWKTLRHYIALHELLCIFSVSATVFEAIFWFIYSSMVISNVEVIHRLDIYSMHCGLISERLCAYPLCAWDVGCLGSLARCKLYDSRNMRRS